MSLTLVGGEWQTIRPPDASAPQSSTSSAQPIALRPLVPQAAKLDDYAWRVKAVLSHRLLLALRLCFLSSAAPAWFWLMATEADDLVLSSLLMGFRAACFGAAVSAGLLPLLVLRGRRRTTQRYNAPTRLRRYVNLFSNGSFSTALIAYTMSGVALSLLLAFGLGVSAPVKVVLPASAAHSNWQFNEAFLFHSLVLVSLIGSSALQHCLDQRNSVTVPNETTPLASRFFNSITTSLPVSLLRALALAASSVIGFGAFSLVRRTVLIFLLRYLPGIAAVRGNLYALFKGGGIIASTWGFVFFELVFVTTAWEVVNVLADVYFSQPVTVSTSASNSTKAILDGLSSRDPLIQSLAYRELAFLASNDANWRKAVFRDIRSTPNGFSRISKACLDLLSRTNSTAEGRGQAKPAAPASTGVAAPGTASPQPAMERAVVQREGSIFRPTRKGFLDNLSQSEKRAALAAKQAPPPQSASSPAPNSTSTPSSNAAPPGAGAGSAASPSKQADERAVIPAIFRIKQSPAGQQQPSAASAPPPPASAPAAPFDPLVALESRLVQRFPQRLGTIASARVAQCLPDPQLNIWTCEALASLVAASISEDDYGLVQQELPKILELLVTFSATIEGLTAELNKAGPGSEQAVLQIIAPVASALQSALARIADVFGPYLQDFRLTPSTLARLRQQVDWSAKQ